MIVLLRYNDSEWVAPCFLRPNKNDTILLLPDFIELNKCIKMKPYPITNIQVMPLKLEGFRFATSLDLNTGYYHVQLTPNALRLCTILLPWGT